MPPRSAIRVTDTESTGAPLAFAINSRQRINTPSFQGDALLLVRTSQPEFDAPHAEYFTAHPKRAFELQIQGKFSQQANHAPIYLGALIKDTRTPQGQQRTAPTTLDLSFIKRKLCSLLLSLIGLKVVGLNYSFGDEDNHTNPQSALPHIVFNMAQGVDAVIETKSGQTLPQLGTAVDLASHPDALPRSVLTSPEFAFNPESIYSLSFWTDNLDLYRWKAVHLPVSDLDLHSVWRDFNLVLLAYQLSDQCNATTRAASAEDAEVPALHLARASAATSDTASTAGPERRDSASGLSNSSKRNSVSKVSSAAPKHSQANMRPLFALQVDHSSNLQATTSKAN